MYAFHFEIHHNSLQVRSRMKYHETTERNKTVSLTGYVCNEGQEFINIMTIIRVNFAVLQSYPVGWYCTWISEQFEFVEKHNLAFFQLANVKKKPYNKPRLLYRTGGSFLVKKIYRSINGSNKRRLSLGYRSGPTVNTTTVVNFNL